jgi:hypothetical protein
MSRQIQRPVQRLIESMQAELQIQDIAGELFSYTAMFPSKVDELCINQTLFAYAANNDPDVMYLHEAMQQPDRKQFIAAMCKEVEGKTKNGNLSIVPQNTVPEGASILPAVWAMRQKQRIDT